jgi:hypothetical protein
MGASPRTADCRLHVANLALLFTIAANAAAVPPITQVGCGDRSENYRGNEQD